MCSRIRCIVPHPMLLSQRKLSLPVSLVSSLATSLCSTMLSIRYSKPQKSLLGDLAARLSNSRVASPGLREYGAPVAAIRCSFAVGSAIRPIYVGSGLWDDLCADSLPVQCRDDESMIVFTFEDACGTVLRPSYITPGYEAVRCQSLIRLLACFESTVSVSPLSDVSSSAWYRTAKPVLRHSGQGLIISMTDSARGAGTIYAMLNYLQSLLVRFHSPHHSLGVHRWG